MSTMDASCKHWLVDVFGGLEFMLMIFSLVRLKFASWNLSFTSGHRRLWCTEISICNTGEFVDEIMMCSAVENLRKETIRERFFPDFFAHGCRWLDCSHQRCTGKFFWRISRWLRNNVQAASLQRKASLMRKTRLMRKASLVQLQIRKTSKAFASKLTKPS